MAREKMPDVIVLLPGITGSELKKNGKVVWGWSGKALGKNLLTLGGQFYDDLALARDSATEESLGDGITAEKVIPDLHLFPGLWKIDGYTKVSDYIRQEFEVEEGRNFFSFPYDWRRDNRFSARMLQKKTADWLRTWRQGSGKADAKLILVGHSMGGLVSRYFLEVLEGWRDTRALITFGTPYRGAVNAVNSLSNGEKKFGILDLTRLARTLTALYQLLPIYECYDAGDGKLQRVAEAAGVPNVDAARAQDALRFHREIEDAVNRHLDDGQYRDQGYRTYPVVGYMQPTSQSARKDGNGVEILPTYKGEDLGGDGTVPRVSATPIEQKDAAGAMFAATKHGSLQNADTVLTQLRGLMTGFYIAGPTFRAARPTGVRLTLENDDVYAAGEKIAIRARPQPPGGTLAATFEDVESGQEVLRAPLRKQAEGWQSVEFPPPRAGAYRVTVTGDDVLEPARDAFEVLPAAPGGR